MAVLAFAPSGPNTDTSPDGGTEPSAPRSATAAVTGPGEPAASARSICGPSAAVPAAPVEAQLTEVIANSAAPACGSLGPPSAHVPLAWGAGPGAGFNPAGGNDGWSPAQSSQGPTFGQGVEPEIVPPDVRHP
jgi:hypothetical protein